MFIIISPKARIIPKDLISEEDLTKFAIKYNLCYSELEEVDERKFTMINKKLMYNNKIECNWYIYGKKFAEWLETKKNVNNNTRANKMTRRRRKREKMRKNWRSKEEKTEDNEIIFFDYYCLF